MAPQGAQNQGIWLSACEVFNRSKLRHRRPSKRLLIIRTAWQTRLVTSPFSLLLPSRMARGTFGLASSRRGRGSFRGYRGNTSFRGGRGRGRGGGPGDSAPKRADDGTQLEERFEQVRLNDEVDEKLGFGRIQEGGRKEAWLVNMHPVCGNGSFDHAPYSITDA